MPSFRGGFLYLAGVAVITALAGCAQVNDWGLSLVTSKVDAFAIVNNQLLSGNVYLVPDRTGRVTLGSDPDAARSCAGALRYTAVNGGLIDLHCGDGSDGQLEFSLVSDTRGYAYGLLANVPVSLVFGMSEQDAPAYLKAPPGRKLLVNEADGSLMLK